MKKMVHKLMGHIGMICALFNCQNVEMKAMVGLTILYSSLK